MNNAEPKTLKAGSRVCWQGNPADGGKVTATSWDAVSIAWDNGQVTRVHYGDMREIHLAKKIMIDSVTEYTDRPVKLECPGGRVQA